MILNNIEVNSSIVEGMFEMVHEVKNSIAVCRGYLDIIDCNNDKDIDKYISILKSEINRSANIISDFMLYRKINVEKEIMDINLLLKELYDDIKVFIETKAILFEINVDDEIYINGDYNKLKQVFINLIKNAIEAINDNGIIKISSFYSSEFCGVIIEDNGCGMNKDIINEISKGNFTTKVDGNGIGVSFSKQIIELHDGNISYDSIFGKGTKVIVKLPVVML